MLTSCAVLVEVDRQPLQMTLMIIRQVLAKENHVYRWTTVQMDLFVNTILMRIKIFAFHLQEFCILLKKENSVTI